MFERYSQKDRRVVFWARYEASQYGSRSIEPEHLLLGILRERRSLHPQPSDIRKDIESHISRGPSFSTLAEVPLSETSKRVLNLASEEAAQLSHERIGIDHILIALLLEQSLASQILRAHGINRFVLHEDSPAPEGDESEIDTGIPEWRQQGSSRVRLCSTAL